MFEEKREGKGKEKEKEKEELATVSNVAKEKCESAIEATNKLAKFLNQSGFTSYLHDFDGELLQYLEFSLIAACGDEETFKYYTENVPYPCPNDLNHLFYNDKSNFREREANNRDYANKEGGLVYLESTFFAWLKRPERSQYQSQFKDFPMGLKLDQCTTLEDKKILIKDTVVKLYKAKLYGSRKVRAHIVDSADRYDNAKNAFHIGSLSPPLIAWLLGSSATSLGSLVGVMLCCTASSLCRDEAQGVLESNSQGLYDKDSKINYTSTTCQFFSRGSGGSTPESREAYLLKIPSIADTIKEFEDLLDEILKSTLVEERVESVAGPSSGNGYEIIVG